MDAISVEIIKNAQNGDVEAFQEIYEKTYQHVFSYALKLSKNEADAKDIAQETYIQVYQRESKTGITYRVLLPLTTIAFFAKIKEVFQNGSFAQKMLAFSCASMIVVSAVAVTETIPYV